MLVIGAVTMTAALDSNGAVDRGQMRTAMCASFISVVRCRLPTAPLVHALALLMAGTVFSLFLRSLLPLYDELFQTGNWLAVGYLALFCVFLPLYWPSAAYRLLIMVLLPAARRLPVCRYPVLSDEELPGVSIVVATRNEPASVVVPLLAALRRFSYPKLEVVVADNSDLLRQDHCLNTDLIRIAEFADKNGVRFVRRARGPLAGPLTGIVPRLLDGARIEGDTVGAKAGNLNTAIASADARYQWIMILDADSELAEESLRQMVSAACQATPDGRRVGFVQSVFEIGRQDETAVSRALRVIDEIYYDKYFRIKAAFGKMVLCQNNLTISQMIAD